MSLSISCSLCLTPGSTFKCLLDDNNQFNNIYEIAVKYFKEELSKSKECLSSTVICLKCWKRIDEFHNFQQFIRNISKSANYFIPILRSINHQVENKLNDASKPTGISTPVEEKAIEKDISIDRFQIKLHQYEKEYFKKTSSNMPEKSLVTPNLQIDIQQTNSVEPDQTKIINPQMNSTLENNDSSKADAVNYKQNEKKIKASNPESTGCVNIISNKNLSDKNNINTSETSLLQKQNMDTQQKVTAEPDKEKNSTLKSLKNFSQLISYTTIKFECEICKNIKFSTYCNLTRHLKRCHKIYKYPGIKQFRIEQMSKNNEPSEIQKENITVDSQLTDTTEADLNKSVTKQIDSTTTSALENDVNSSDLNKSATKQIDSTTTSALENDVNSSVKTSFLELMEENNTITVVNISPNSKQIDKAEANLDDTLNRKSTGFVAHPDDINKASNNLLDENHIKTTLIQSQKLDTQQQNVSAVPKYSNPANFVIKSKSSLLKKKQKRVIVNFSEPTKYIEINDYKIECKICGNLPFSNYFNLKRHFKNLHQVVNLPKHIKQIRKEQACENNENSNHNTNPESTTLQRSECVQPKDVNTSEIQIQNQIIENQQLCSSDTYQGESVTTQIIPTTSSLGNEDIDVNSSIQSTILEIMEENNTTTVVNISPNSKQIDKAEANLDDTLNRKSHPDSTGCATNDDINKTSNNLLDKNYIKTSNTLIQSQKLDTQQQKVSAVPKHSNPANFVIKSKSSLLKKKQKRVIVNFSEPTKYIEINDYKIKCIICENVTFSNYFNLKRHFKNQHQVNLPKITQIIKEQLCENNENSNHNTKPESTTLQRSECVQPKDVNTSEIQIQNQIIENQQSCSSDTYQGKSVTMQIIPTTSSLGNEDINVNSSIQSTILELMEENNRNAENENSTTIAETSNTDDALNPASTEFSKPNSNINVNSNNLDEKIEVILNSTSSFQNLVTSSIRDAQNFKQIKKSQTCKNNDDPNQKINPNPTLLLQRSEHAKPKDVNVILPGKSNVTTENEMQNEIEIDNRQTNPADSVQDLLVITSTSSSEKANTPPTTVEGISLEQINSLEFMEDANILDNRKAQNPLTINNIPYIYDKIEKADENRDTTVFVIQDDEDVNVISNNLSDKNLAITSIAIKQNQKLNIQQEVSAEPEQSNPAKFAIPEINSTSSKSKSLVKKNLTMPVKFNTSESTTTYIQINGTKFICKICKSSNSNYFNLKRHFKLKHQIVNLPKIRQIRKEHACNNNEISNQKINPESTKNNSFYNQFLKYTQKMLQKDKSKKALNLRKRRHQNNNISRRRYNKKPVFSFKQIKKKINSKPTLLQGSERAKPKDVKVILPDKNNVTTENQITDNRQTDLADSVQSPLVITSTSSFENRNTPPPAAVEFISFEQINCLEFMEDENILDNNPLIIDNIPCISERIEKSDENIEDESCVCATHDDINKTSNNLSDKNHVVTSEILMQSQKMDTQQEVSEPEPEQSNPANFGNPQINSTSSKTALLKKNSTMKVKVNSSDYTTFIKINGKKFICKICGNLSCSNYFNLKRHFKNQHQVFNLPNIIQIRQEQTCKNYKTLNQRINPKSTTKSIRHTEIESTAVDKKNNTQNRPQKDKSKKAPSRKYTLRKRGNQKNNVSRNKLVLFKSKSSESNNKTENTKIESNKKYTLRKRRNQFDNVSSKRSKKTANAHAHDKVVKMVNAVNLPKQIDHKDIELKSKRQKVIAKNESKSLQKFVNKESYSASRKRQHNISKFLRKYQRYKKVQAYKYCDTELTQSEVPKLVDETLSSATSSVITNEPKNLRKNYNCSKLSTTIDAYSSKEMNDLQKPEDSIHLDSLEKQLQKPHKYKIQTSNKDSSKTKDSKMCQKVTGMSSQQSGRLKTNNDTNSNYSLRHMKNETRNANELNKKKNYKISQLKQNFTVKSTLRNEPILNRSNIAKSISTTEFSTQNDVNVNLPTDSAHSKTLASLLHMFQQPEIAINTIITNFKSTNNPPTSNAVTIDDKLKTNENKLQTENSLNIETNSFQTSDIIQKDPGLIINSVISAHSTPSNIAPNKDQSSSSRFTTLRKLSLKKCYYCSKTFKYANSLKKHIKIVHTKMENYSNLKLKKPQIGSLNEHNTERLNAFDLSSRNDNSNALNESEMVSSIANLKEEKNTELSSELTDNSDNLSIATSIFLPPLDIVDIKQEHDV